VLVLRTDDRLSAVAADANTAATLGIPAGAPLLRIDRITFTLDDKPIEWRVSLYHLDARTTWPAPSDAMRHDMRCSSPRRSG
jgi:DNA-binding GntR family transcriptional regulator